MTTRVTPYTGRSVQPRREPVVYRCTCGERFATDVWRAIDAGDPYLRARLVEGDLNRVRCPRCDADADVQVSVLFHDAGACRLVFVAPPSDRHRELALRAELFTLLAADAVPPPDYVLAAEVVFGAAGLIELLARSAASSVPLPIPEPPLVMPEPMGAHETSEHETFEPETLEGDARSSEDAAPPRVVPTLTAAADDHTFIAPLPVADRNRSATLPDLEVAVVAALAQRRTLDFEHTPLPPHAPPAPDGSVVRAAAEVSFSRAATLVVPDPRTAVIERWIAARELATALFVDDRVVICAALPPAILEQFVGRDGKKVRVSLRPQLHRMATFPLLVLTFVAGEDGERPDESRVIHVPLDLGRAGHRVAVDQLVRRCYIELELFDTDYLSVVSMALSTPLEDHLRHLVGEAKQALERLPVATRSFDRARAAFFGAGYDRLGRTAIDLPTLDDITRATPSGVRGALQAVSRWSESAAESYLLEIRGFPLPVWRRLATTAIRRAIEIGLFVPRGLAERVARRAEEALDLPAWPALVELQVRRFAELSARLRPSDLSPADEAANWEQLLRESDAQGIGLDDAVHRLADAAFARVGGRPSRRIRSTRETAGAAPGAAPNADVAAPIEVSFETRMADRPVVELLPLLEDREHRLETAIAIAVRRESPTLPALFAALRRMSRAEASALLPHLAAFGTPAERWIVGGLASKKAFMRQGCALALGRLATPLAIDALVRLLFDEPTEIWTEIARAIGDVGTPAVTPLAAHMRSVEGDARERVVTALAQIASRSDEGEQAAHRAAVEALANGRDALVANAARRALALAPAVHSAHEAMRSDRREQTLVRAFTQRFYEALGGDDEEPVELSDEELEAFEADDASSDDDEVVSDVSFHEIDVRGEPGSLAQRVRDQPTRSVSLPPAGGSPSSPTSAVQSPSSGAAGTPRARRPSS